MIMIFLSHLILVMNKKEFIYNIKKYFPENYRVNFKTTNGKLLEVKSSIFKTVINLHPIFLKGDKNIIQKLIDLIKKRDNFEEAKKYIYDFYKKNNQKKQIKIIHNFKHKDINNFFCNILVELKEKYSAVDFSKLSISWGRATKKRKRFIRFGSYDKKRLLIRIHPVLDNADIPDFFIYSIIYHEIAHFIIAQKNEKIPDHGEIFYQILKSIDNNYKESKNWLKMNKKLFFS